MNDTTLFDDYTKYVTTRFDPAAKANRRAEQFPLECDRAFALGARLCRKAMTGRSE